jgi:hypothetical protein
MYQSFSHKNFNLFFPQNDLRVIRVTILFRTQGIVITCETTFGSTQDADSVGDGKWITKKGCPEEHPFTNYTLLINQLLKSQI